jgi:hypothetical protein
MNVYLVPIGPDGYELYCESHDGVSPEPGAAAGWRQRASEVFRRGLAYLEQERQRRLARRVDRPRSAWRRVRERVVAWLAERVAEQRLLWHLRRHAAATAHFPDDVTREEAAAVVLRSLRRDGARHFRWLLGNAVGVALSSPLTLIPGPNVPFFYFVFRVVGHYLSWSGARHGGSVVVWSYAPCPPLTDLRRLQGLPPADRAAFAQAIAVRLGLEHLDTFAERMALRTP